MANIPFDERRVIDLLATGEPGGALGPLDDFSKRRRIEWIVDHSFGEESASAAPRPGRRLNRAVAVAITIGAAAAAAIVILVGQTFSLREPGRFPTPPLASAPSMSKPLPGASKSRDTAAPLIARETERRVIGPGVQLLLEPDTTARVMKTEKEISLYLKGGTVWLDVDPDEKPRDLTVKVQTDRGMVTVVGTVFGVLETPQFTDVVVLKGTVCVIDRFQRAVWISTGHRIRVGDRMAQPMDPEEIHISWRHLRDHGLALKRAPKASPIEVKPKKITPKHTPGISNTTPERLLKRARRERERGDFRAANRSLERLVREFPASEEASVALVVKGRLTLDQLGMPGTALRHFNAYLASSRNRGLRVEALLGKARAERRLGDTRNACRTLEDFVTQYGKGPLAARARKELASCKTND